MSKPQRRTRVEEQLHDKHAVHHERFRTVGDKAVVWINKMEITEILKDGEWVPMIENKKPVEKCRSFRRIDVPVGETIMGCVVERVPTEWVEREKEILKAWCERK